MNLNLWQQTFPVSAGNVLVMGIYKASAPLALVASYELPGPYTGQTQLHTFTGLQNVVYNYVLYESPDGGADGTQLNYFDIQPSINSYNTRDPLSLVANTSAYFASGTNFYGPDPSLVGWNFYPDIPGTGILQYGVDYVKTVNGTPTTQDDLTANGYEYLAAEYSIGDGEKSVLVFLPQLAATSTPDSGSVISSTSILTANTSLTNSAMGQSFLLQGSGPYFQVTLPALSSISDSIPISFYSAGGNHINVGIFVAGDGPFQWYRNWTDFSSNNNSGHMYLGQSEALVIYKFTRPDTLQPYWLVMSGGEGYRMTGEIIYDYSMIPINTVFANGQLLSRTTYARLWEFVQTAGSNVIADSAFNNTITVNGVTWQTNWGYFTTGDGSTTFRVPKLWAYSYLRLKAGVSGSGYANGFCGDFSAPYVQPHDAAMHGAGVITGGAGPLFLSRSSGGRYAGGGGDTFGGSATVDQSLRTGAASTASTTGENLTAGFGIYALLRT